MAVSTADDKAASEADKATATPEQVRSAWLVHQAEESSLAPVRAFAESQGISLREIGLRDLLDESVVDQAGGAHWVVVCEAGMLSRVFDAAERRQASVGVLPTGNLAWARQLLQLPAEPEARIRLAFTEPPFAVDVLRCNDEVVLGQAAVGDVPFLDRRGMGFVQAQPTRWQRWLTVASLFWTALRRLFAIEPSTVRLTLGEDEKTRNTAVTGIVMLENDVNHLAGRVLDEALSARDGRVSVLLVAPTSVVSYLAFLLRAAGPGRTTVARMPRALSYVKTRRLVIESQTPLAYRVDGHKRSASRIETVVSPRALRVNVGPRFAEMNSAEDAAKDTVRLRNLPENEARLAMIRKRLPVFTHALEDDFKDLFRLLKDSARVSTDYVTLMVLSTFVASFGLLLNSAAVIIGAMVLAPLMAPIISGAMGALRRDVPLIRSSATAIIVGMGTAIAVAALISMLVPIQRITPEIDGRLQPSLLDLGVAVFSGIAGAYAYARESVMKSLPGVAIAVALVPPLSVAGIGVGWLSWEVFSGAMLLFLTNLFGIALAAAATFMVLGYAPVRRSTAGLGLPLLAVILVSIPLYLSFNHIQTVWQVERALSGRSYTVNDRTLLLENPRVAIEDNVARIRADLYAANGVETEDLEALKQKLETVLGRPVSLDLNLRLRY
jgi:uncharacterized hydrophobic protein (TIGR00271 family)